MLLLATILEFLIRSSMGLAALTMITLLFDKDFWQIMIELWHDSSLAGKVGYITVIPFYMTIILVLATMALVGF